uniref:Sterile alpha motif domain containing 1b n=1 Tax=Amphiprion percula TaxID=161767 RepID=A0A3P8SEJ9_AMPPE
RHKERVLSPVQSQAPATTKEEKWRKMSEPNKYREWILETIDSLRSRKARPDLERICRMVRRRHGSDPDRTRTELEKLIQEQTVLKVSYKGSISYRNAAKVERRTRSPAQIPALKHQAATPARSSSLPPARVAETVVAQQRAALSGAARGKARRPLWATEQAHTTVGMPAGQRGAELMQLARGRSPVCPELTTGAKLAPGASTASSSTRDRSRFQERLSEEKLTRGKVKVVMEREVARGRLRRTRCGNITLPLRGTVVEERKNASADRLARSALGEEERRENEEEMEMEEDDPRSSDEEGGLSPVAMTTEPGLIEKTTEDAEIQAASKQESSLHQLQQGGKGVCARMYGAVEKYFISSCLLLFSAAVFSHLSRLIKSEGASGSLVDWTVSDVVSYFTAAGFPEQAAAFRTQEIDGKSLLLMQRNDVLTGLSIRLGPALKIYERHVKVLQKTHFEDDDC